MKCLPCNSQYCLCIPLTGLNRQTDRSGIVKDKLYNYFTNSDPEARFFHKWRDRAAVEYPHPAF